MIKIILFFAIFITNLHAYEIYVDETNSITPERMFKHKDKFHNIEKSFVGILASTLWIKLNIDNHTNEDIAKYILFHTPNFENVTMYYYLDNQLIEKLNGINVRIEKREFKSSQPAFEIALKAQESKTVLVKIKTKQIINFSYQLFDNKKSLLSYISRNLNFGIFILGMAFIIIIFTALVLVYNYHKIYLAYFVFLIATFIIQLFVGGYIQYFYFFENYLIYQGLFIDILAISVSMFLILMLNLNKNMPKLVKLFYLFIIAFIVLFISESFTSQIFYSIKELYILPIFILFSIYIVVYSFILKLQYSTFIMIGWTFYMISTLALLSHEQGIIHNDLYIIFWQMGTLFESIVFSTMLFYRLKLIYEEKVKNEHKLMQQEELLHKQSKFATIGETLSSIEHQWRTPLSKISSNVVNLQSHLEFKGLPTKENLGNSLESISNTLQYMTNLVDEFKSFYMQDKEKVLFDCVISLKSALHLLEHNSEKHNIKIIQNYEENSKINGYPNEFTQVCLNIFANSIDMFIQRGVKNPQINIDVFKDNSNIVLSIQDNAGGMEIDKLSKIFDKFFSDKDKTSSGLGLYLVKDIVENRMDGKIDVFNEGSGLAFVLTFDLN